MRYPSSTSSISFQVAVLALNSSVRLSHSLQEPSRVTAHVGAMIMLRFRKESIGLSQVYHLYYYTRRMQMS